MHLFNVLTHKLEPFQPEGEVVTIYVCGITPYDTTHLGHAFTYTTFDILIRTLEFQGRQVRYVQNVTDIDDDILRKAREVGEDWQALGDRWTRHFVDDNQALNVRPPDVFPRATDVIDEIINAVQELLSAGVAYESDGNVYFHVASNPDYGKLSKLSPEEMLPVANERGNNPDDPNKRHPLDFVLWQAQSPGEPAWDSLWGPGRPGWHIECSTMSGKYLDHQIDIHGGGADLIFPHHESEIAQFECATRLQPFSRFWLHVAMVRYQGEKMSKSLGNLVMVRDLMEAGYSADALRLYMASHHYRQAWSYDEEELEQAASLAQRLLQASVAQGGSGQWLDPEPWKLRFLSAMEDDLNSPSAVETLKDLAGEIEDGVARGFRIGDAQEALRDLGGLLGLRLAKDGPEERVVTGWQNHRRRFASSPLF